MTKFIVIGDIELFYSFSVVVEAENGNEAASKVRQIYRGELGISRLLHESRAINSVKLFNEEKLAIEKDE